MLYSTLPSTEKMLEGVGPGALGFLTFCKRKRSFETGVDQLGEGSGDISKPPCSCQFITSHRDGGKARVAITSPCAGHELRRGAPRAPYRPQLRQWGTGPALPPRTPLGCAEQLQPRKPGLILRHSWRSGLAAAAVGRKQRGERG